MFKRSFLHILGVINEINIRHCFNCGKTKNKKWDKYLNEHYLCHVCGKYKRSNGKLRTEVMSLNAKKVIVSIFEGI